MMRKLIPSLILAACSQTALAQTVSRVLSDTVQTSFSVDTILGLEEIIHIPQKVGTGIGFRISIYDGGSNNSARLAASRAARLAKLYFPELSATPKFKGHWRCLIGDFRTYEDAAKYLNEVRKHFPEAVVARREAITLYE